MNRRILISVLVIIMAVAAITGGTFAWFTATNTVATNTFQAGTVSIDADEQFAYTTGLKNWNPGDHVDKKIEVTNDGTKRLLLRAKIDEKWTDVGFKAGGVDKAANTAIYARNIDNVLWKLNIGTDLAPDYVEWHHDNWQYNSADNYWYYKGILYPTGYNEADPYAGNGTAEVATTVHFLNQVWLDGASTGNTFQGKTYTIGVTFEAIQATNNAELSQWGVDFTPSTFADDAVSPAYDKDTTGTWVF